MKKSILIILFSVLLFLSLESITAKAEESEEIIAYYFEFDNFSSNEEKVYVSEECKDILILNGVDVFTESVTTGWWIFSKTTYYYYYLTNDNLGRIVDDRALSSSMDSVIYMVSQLENYANSYIVQNNVNQSASSLVLSYLRNINVDYSDLSSILYDEDGIKSIFTEFLYSITCGVTNMGFVNYVNETESRRFANVPYQTIEIKDYFSLFVNSSQRNSTVFGQFDSRYSMHKFTVREPIEGKQFDLIHFFCVLDSLESKPQNGIKAQVQNIVSYVGDMQQEAARLDDKNDAQILDFERDVLVPDESLFGYGDFFADIDAFNIGRTFLCADTNDFDKNLVSLSMCAYYNMIGNNMSLRYKMFIKTVSMEFIYIPVENSIGSYIITDLQTTGIHGFAYNASRFMNINPQNLENIYSFGQDLPQMKNLKRKSDNTMCSYSMRKDMVKGLVNYILNRAGYEELYA